MHTSYQPSGIYSAQWIPADVQGRIDRSSLAAHIAFERRAGISGVLALGSTGEFPQFSPDERKGALATITELAAPLPVIANVSDIRPRVSVELGRFAKSLGVPAIALMPPPFFPVSQADMLAFFLHVAEQVGLPVMLYNFPELTGKRIDLPTIAAFAERAPMCAIKQSGGEFAYHQELIALGREKSFAVMSGADTRLPEVFKLGGAGCIGGLVNIVPEWMVLIDRVCRQGQSGEFAAAAAAMAEIGRIIDQLTFPLNVAAGLEARGFKPGVPKTIVSEESRRLYAKIVQELVALFQRHQLGLAPSAAA
jgi:dihydrodipicolinate synthase/N-acetylneuraminate lyase